MQQKNRCIRRNGVNLIERRQPLLGELVLGESADDAHPLRSGRAIDLVFEHSQRICERANAVPAQLHIVVQAAADDVHMTIDQPWDRAAPLEINTLRVGTGMSHDIHIASGRDKAAGADRYGRCAWVLPIKVCLILPLKRMKSAAPSKV